MRLEVLDHIPDDSDLRRAWNELALGMEHPEVFFTFEWSIAVQRAFRGLLTPLVFLGYEGSALVGVAALAQKQSGKLMFLAADTADYCDFLSASRIRGKFVQAVLSELKARSLRNAVFTNLPADSATVHAISDTCSGAGYHLHIRAAYDCAQVQLGSPDERLLLRQSVLARKRLRRNMRELAKRGTVALRHETDWTEIQPLLPQFTRAHVARFLELGKTSNLVREERRIFLEELARELSPSRSITFSRLLIDEVTAAWNYGFRFAGSWFWYQPTVGDCYGDFSPGYCLLAKIVETACDSSELDLVDLGLGAEGYKERFANANRQTLYCELNKSYMRYWRTRVRHEAAALATASPPIEKRIRSLLSVLGEVRRTLATLGFAGTLNRARRRIRHALFSFDKVKFFEWSPDEATPNTSGVHLEPLTSNVLGEAAIQYGNDPASLRFLMRSAKRLRSGGAEGFALMTDQGVAVHFCWTKQFQGFEMAELERVLQAPSQNSVMIFDCFTPESARGHDFFPRAISMVARRLSTQDRSAWIFGAETNLASVRGIEKTGFRYKFTLGRRRLLLFSKTMDSVPLSFSLREEHKLSTS